MESKPGFERQVPDVLRVAEDREPLAAKLEEYKSRYQKYMAPEGQLDTIYKIAITQELVETGEAKKEELRQALIAQHGHIDKTLFESAWYVLYDYITTAGRTVIGGTGLYPENGGK